MKYNLGNQNVLEQAKCFLFKIGQKWAIILRIAVFWENGYCQKMLKLRLKSNFNLGKKIQEIKAKRFFYMTNKPTLSFITFLAHVKTLKMAQKC